MKLHTLKPAEGSTKTRKRIARGQGSGRGGTATRGHKGAKSRSGYSRKLGFEGGQMPLQRRVPKFGFNRPQKEIFKPINLGTIQELADKGIETIDLEVLVKNGLSAKKDKVKILGGGELKAKVTVTAHAFSNTAKENIEKAGGTANLVGE